MATPKQDPPFHPWNPYIHKALLETQVPHTMSEAPSFLLGSQGPWRERLWVDRGSGQRSSQYPTVQVASALWTQMN